MILDLPNSPIMFIKVVNQILKLKFERHFIIHYDDKLAYDSNEKNISFTQE